MKTAQIIIVVLIALDLGVALVMHGKSYPRPINFWRQLFTDAIILGMLYWGGFFSAGG